MSCFMLAGVTDARMETVALSPVFSGLAVSGAFTTLVCLVVTEKPGDSFDMPAALAGGVLAAALTGAGFLTEQQQTVSSAPQPNVMAVSEHSGSGAPVPPFYRTNPPSPRTF